MIASIDHAMWFHRSVRVDEWLLYATDSPSASGARGFTRGSVFARDGRLVASTSQEGSAAGDRYAECHEGVDHHRAGGRRDRRTPADAAQQPQCRHAGRAM